MKALLRNLFVGLSVSLLLAACGGGDGDGDGGSSPGAAAPVARVFADKQAAEAGDVIALDGTASSTSGSGTLRYQWSLEKPGSSLAVLSGPTSSKPTFVADLPGSYVASLVVSDGSASSSPSSVTIQVTNPNPIAIAAPLAYGKPGTIVQLDGIRSLAPQGESSAGLRFAWTLISLPAGSQAVLDNPALAQPRFTPDVVGDYVAELIVRHGSKVSPPVQVLVKVEKANAIPVASAGPDIKNAIRDQEITLDGTPSTDADGDTLQYRWRFLAVPLAEGAVELKNANTAKPSFTPKAAGNYTLTLHVYDGTSRSSEVRLIVSVIKPVGAPNTPPVADIGTPWGGTSELELGRSWQLSHAGTKDPDGQYSSSAYAREWTLVSAPAGFDAAANTVFGTSGWDASSFTPTHAGNYRFRLRVQDPDGAWSAPVERTFSVLTGANRAPAAAAKTASGAPTVLVGATVNLDGSDSSDIDGNRLTYRWELLERPDGSRAVLQNAESVRASFVADVAGPYIASLRVTDEHGWPSTAAPTRGAEVVVLVKTRNTPPIARLSALSSLYTSEQPFLITDTVPGTVSWTLNNDRAVARGSSFYASAEAYDPDGDPLSYIWLLNNEPAGNTMRWPLEPATGTHSQCYNTAQSGGFSYVALDWASFEAFQTHVLGAREWTCSGTLLSPALPGTYNLEVLVSDGTDVVGPFTTSVPAVRRSAYPSLLLENLHTAHQWSNADQRVTLQGSSNQPTQVVFPFDKTFSQSSRFDAVETLPNNIGIVDSVGLINPAFKGNLVLRTFRLTAGGGNYTITDLQAFDKDGVETPRFVGLTNNQLIRQGQSVDFQVVWPISQSPLAGAGYGGYQNKNGMVWSFKIAEKPGFTFYFNPGSVQ